MSKRRKRMSRRKSSIVFKKGLKKNPRNFMRPIGRGTTRF